MAFALLAGGCTTATSALWDRQKDHPTDHPLIKLAFDPQRNDILVRYNEHTNDNALAEERAYWLFASANSSSAQKAPVFVSNPDFEHLEPIPVFPLKMMVKRGAPAGYAAVAEPTSRKFELWRDGMEIHTYKLPDYSKWGPATPWRVALTPLAVTGDAALTVGAVACVSIYASNGQVLLLALALAHR